MRRYTSVPLCGVGGLNDPDFVEQQLASGRIDVYKRQVYGCEMAFHKVCDDDPAGITAAILEAKDAGCELIFTTGGMSVDPDDRTPLALSLIHI